MTDERATPRFAFTEAMRKVDTTPACVRDIAGKALLGYNLAAMDHEVPSGLWASTEAFARDQVSRAVALHEASCDCVGDPSKHSLRHRKIPLPELN